MCYLTIRPGHEPERVTGQTNLYNLYNFYNLYNLYNNHINARALIGQSAVCYCAGKPTEKSRIF